MYRSVCMYFRHGCRLAALLTGVVLLTASAAAHEGVVSSDPQEGRHHHDAAGAVTAAARQSQPSAPRGRKLFASKGCVACHSVNGIGGGHATAFDDYGRKTKGDPYQFVSNMWQMASVMIPQQEEVFGEQIEFSGRELADIAAFVHDTREQRRFSMSDVPPRIMKLMNHAHMDMVGGASGAEKGHGDHSDAPKSHSH